MVCLSKDNTKEYNIDTTVFDDPFMEALTRAIEHIKLERVATIKIRPVATCWDIKTPAKQYAYNSYWAMINASMFSRAELLREKFKLQSDIDLATQPYCGTQ